MRQGILQGVIQMLLHQISGFGKIACTVGMINLRVHLVDLFLGFGFCFIKVGKNGELAA